MEAILNSKPEDFEDYYGLLGCDELSTTEQIINEYKIRALACHPDKHLDNPRAVSQSVPLSDVLTSKQIMLMESYLQLHTEKRVFISHYSVSIMFSLRPLTLSLCLSVADFQKLQEAKEVLCNEAKRKNYDLWRRSGVTISFHDWQALNDSVKTSMHWAVRDKKEPMLEASRAENPATSQAEELRCEQEAEGISSYDAVPSSSDYCHRRFRWAADSPSSLLQKFRNYEI